jgi:S-adenosyl methyltransferase
MRGGQLVGETHGGAQISRLCHRLWRGGLSFMRRPCPPSGCWPVRGGLHAFWSAGRRRRAGIETSTMAEDWPQNSLDPSGSPPSGMDTSVPHVARVHNYWLDGKDNFAADREAAEQVIAAYPGILRDVRARGRSWLIRRGTWRAGQPSGSFFDVGTGIPTANNTHQVAQGVEPDCKVVYADNDPMVLVHARALLAGTTARPPTSMPAWVTPARSWQKRPGCRTSASRSRSC